MAALGQLTAGIAHEIKNPLNFVNNFAALSNELLEELKEIAAPALETLDDDTRADIDETIDMLTGNLEKIAEHGRRADNIVKSMLAHSRGVERRANRGPTSTRWSRRRSISPITAPALRTRTSTSRWNAISTRSLAPIELVPQDMMRVFLNLIGNGFLRRAQTPSGDRRRRLPARPQSGDARPRRRGRGRVRDNGTGIRPEHRDKLFQPFFTTKPTGEGTGLGLSISYDIVTQQHGGTIAVESEPGEFTEFTVRLPREPTARATAEGAA